MSTPYTTQLCSYQNLGPGASFNINIGAYPASCTVVVRTVVAYCGNPSPVAPNSIVITQTGNAVGNPTIYSYNSGVTGSSTPIYDVKQLGLVVGRYTGSGGPNGTLLVKNTAAIATSSWDICVTGWIIQGLAPSAFTF